MKIKVIKLKNRVVIVDNTNCIHTKSLLNSTLATLDDRKQLIDLDEIFINRYYFDPFENYSGYKSLVNTIIPKTNSLDISKDSIESIRNSLASLFEYYDKNISKLSLYGILMFLNDSDAIKKAYQATNNKLLVNNEGMNVVLNHLSLLTIHPFIAKSNTLRAIKKLIPLSSLPKEEILLLSTNDKNTAGNNLLINSIKAVEKEEDDEQTIAWTNLISSFLDEIGIYT